MFGFVWLKSIELEFSRKLPLIGWSVRCAYIQGQLVNNWLRLMLTSLTQSLFYAAVTLLLL